MLIDGKTSFEFARNWYQPSEIHRSINSKHSAPFGEPSIPGDVHSMEFATWLADQYALAMNKGMELAERALTPAAPRSYADGVRDAVKVVERHGVIAVNGASARSARGAIRAYQDKLLDDLRSLLASEADADRQPTEQKGG